MRIEKEKSELREHFTCSIHQKMKKFVETFKGNFLKILSLSSFSKDEKELLKLTESYSLKKQVLLHSILQVYVDGDADKWFSLENEVRVILAENYGALSKDSLRIVNILGKFFKQDKHIHAHFVSQRGEELNLKIKSLSKAEQISIEQEKSKFLA